MCVKGIEADLMKPAIREPISGVASPMPLITEEGEGNMLIKTAIQEENPPGKTDAYGKLCILFHLRHDLALCKLVDCLNTMYDISDGAC